MEAHKNCLIFAGTPVAVKGKGGCAAQKIMSNQLEK